jgi:protein-disulfide isomerase
MGVEATPTFFIGAQRLNGAAPYEKLAEMVRAELQRAPASR